MPILTVKNLTKSFGSTEVLKDISFSMEEGEVLSIIGSSGSGKTTILRCINSLETADGGIITVGGQVVFDGKCRDRELTKEEEAKRRSSVGLVFQSFNLFPQYNVLENVTLAMKLAAKKRPDYKQDKRKILSEIDEEAKAIIAKMGLSDKLSNYPCELSGGQQQRVSIARALALHPKILFFDEPTSALDPELTGEILKVIKELAKEKMTMVIVTHEMSFARDVSDKVIFMDDGFIVEQGTPEEVFNNTSNPRTIAFLQRFNEN